MRKKGRKKGNKLGKKKRKEKAMEMEGWKGVEGKESVDRKTKRGRI